jgi:hypothetical protein
MKAPNHIATITATMIMVAIAAPLAHATRPDDRATHGVGAVAVGTTSTRPETASDYAGSAVPDVFERAAQRAILESTVTHPEEGSVHAESALPAPSTIVVPDVFERAAQRAILESTVGHPEEGSVYREAAPPAATAISAMTGFDWMDAAIGAMGGIVIALVLAGSAIFLVSRRSGARAHVAAR